MKQLRLVYLTAKEYPATTADHIYIRFLAKAFAKKLGDRFQLIVRGYDSEDFVGIPTYLAKVPRQRRTLFYFFWLPRYIGRNLKTGESLVFFCNDFNLLTILAFWKPFFGNRYRICSDWHLMSETWKDAYVASRSDVIITTSKRLKNILIERLGISHEKVSVIYGGIEYDSYLKPVSSREALGLPVKHFLVGYVGLFKTMGREKGISTMVQTLPFLPDEVAMVFVGGTPDEIEEYVNLAVNLNVSHRCIWIEKKPFNEVVQYERGMDVLVIPYPNEPHFRDYGFPMKVYEYLAAEKPIVYSDLEILDEVLSEVGISFKADDLNSLANILLNLYLRKDVAQKTGTPSRYSWDEKARLILEAIEK